MNNRIKGMGLMLVAVLALCASEPAASAQTNTNSPADLPGEVGTVLDFIGAPSTNWYAAGYGIYDTASRSAGAGFGLAYSLDDQLGLPMPTMPTLRLEYLNHTLYMMSGSLELRPPQKWLGKVPITPLVSAGAKIPIAGLGSDNGNPIPFAGFGVSTRVSKRVGILAGAERRFGSHQGWQVLGGLWYNF